MLVRSYNSVFWCFGVNHSFFHCYRLRFRLLIRSISVYSPLGFALSCPVLCDASLKVAKFLAQGFYYHFYSPRIARPHCHFLLVFIPFSFLISASCRDWSVIISSSLLFISLSTVVCFCFLLGRVSYSELVCVAMPSFRRSFLIISSCNSFISMCIPSCLASFRLRNI